MKVIFLDIDGVLNSNDSLSEGIQIANYKSQLLGRIVDETDAKIVISSSWRRSHLLLTLDTLLWVTGGPFKAIIGATPDHFGKPRGTEIKAWLEGPQGKSKNVTNYVILDDESDMLEEQKPYFVKTEMRSGLTTKLALKAIEILNTEIL